MTTSNSVKFSAISTVSRKMPPCSETYPTYNDGREREYQHGYFNGNGRPPYDGTQFWQPPSYRIPTYHGVHRPYTYGPPHFAHDRHFQAPHVLVPPPSDTSTQVSPLGLSGTKSVIDSKNVTSEALETCRELGPFDVVCGRGAPTDYNPGNLWFRNLAQQFETSYLCAKRSDKPGVAKKLLQAMQSHGGRFVRRERSASGMVWIEIEDRRAYEKVCQALRDGAPGLRKQVFALSKAKVARARVDHDSENKPYMQNL